MSGGRRVLIVGGDSLIGRAVGEGFATAGDNVYFSTRRGPYGSAQRPYLDLLAIATGAMDPNSLPPVDIAILAAAVARVNDCEAAPEETWQVNVEGSARVARCLAAQGAYVVMLSSDKVFDGRVAQRRRDDPPCPETAYGRQKAALEAIVLELPGGAVLRLSKVLLPSLALLADWTAALRQGQTVEAFDDFTLAPVTPEHIGRVVRAMAAERSPGLFHCTGAADRSYAELAAMLAAAVGADPALVLARPTPDHIVSPAARCPHTALDMSEEGRRWGIEPPTMEAVVAELASGL